MTKAKFSVKELASIVEGTLLKGEGKLKFSPEQVLIDSRKYRESKHKVFFSIKGSANNGHDYIEQLYDKGLRNFVVSEPIEVGFLAGATVIVVKNTIEALQLLALAHRKKFELPVIGITGSNGKTIVKEWLFEGLFTNFHVVRSPRSYNSQVGVPLSILLLTEHHNLGIFEAGISQRNEMDALAEIIQPSIGIFTNIGEAHQENFASLEEKIQEKLKLFSKADVLIYSKDHELIDREINKTFAKSGPKKLMWSFAGPADLQLNSPLINDDQTVLKGVYNEELVEIKLPFTDKASIENACHVWLTMLHLGMDNAQIQKQVKTLKPIEMRLEKIDGLNDCVVINDSYNSDINAIEIALDYLLIQTKNKKNTAIISDILQSGYDSKTLYSRLAKLIKERNIDRFIGVGRELSTYSYLFDGVESYFVPDTQSLIKNFYGHNFNSENILIKGARHFEFEKIAKLLEQKSHETVLEIDLSKMALNLNLIRSKLHKETKIMVMVKAFAYGSKGYDVARFLEYNRVNYLAVAYTDEGIALRQNGITMPIMILNPELAGYNALIRYDLEPQLYSFRTLKSFTDALNYSTAETPYPVHIKLNTGMNRLGFNPEEIDALKLFLKENDQLEVKTVFSHLAASDDTKFDELTQKQFDRFKTMSEKLDLPKAMHHILNSSGILRHPDAQYDMVRLGLALYGFSSNTNFRSELKPVGRLKTIISQIRIVPPGEGVGYSPRKFLTEKKVIGIVPMGYADGLPRKLGNGKGKVFVNGIFVPFVGNICMDMAMIDLTDAKAEEGDSVEIFGEYVSVYDIAKSLETIPYEVLTNISQRVKRVFIQE